MMLLDANKRAYAALIVGAATIGFAPILMRLSEVGPTATAFWRTGLAVPALFLFWIYSGGRPAMLLQDTKALKLTLAAGFAFAVDLFLWHWSLTETSVANATFLSNLAAFFTALVSVVFLGMRLNTAFVVGLFVALAGAGLMASSSTSNAHGTLFGDILGIGTAVAYAFYILFTAWGRQRIDTLALMVVSSASASVFLLAMALAGGEVIVPVHAWGWAVVLAMALIVHCLGQGLIAYGLNVVPAATGSLTLLVQPVLAAIVAWILFNEAMGALQIFGGMLVLVGIAWAKTRGTLTPRVTTPSHRTATITPIAPALPPVSNITDQKTNINPSASMHKDTD